MFEEMNPAPPVTRIRFIEMAPTALVRWCSPGPRWARRSNPAELLPHDRHQRAVEAQQKQHQRPEEDEAGRAPVPDPVDQTPHPDADARKDTDNRHGEPHPLRQPRPEPGHDLEAHLDEGQRPVAALALAGPVLEVDLDDPARRSSRRWPW